jgi:hypothetical protein
MIPFPPIVALAANLAAVPFPPNPVVKARKINAFD